MALFNDNWQIIVCGNIVLLLMLGYIPGVKKYLPHLKPKICSKSGIRPCKDYSLSILSCILPYVAVRAVINPNASGMLSGGASVEIKAKTSGGKFVIVNSKSFEYKTNEEKPVKASVLGGGAEAPKGGYVMSKASSIIYTKGNETFTLVMAR